MVDPVNDLVPATISEQPRNRSFPRTNNLMINSLFFPGLWTNKQDRKFLSQGYFLKHDYRGLLVAKQEILVSLPDSARK